MTLLELRGIGKRFGAVTALEDVTFELRAGEVVALLGDNGAGKSTLAKIIAGTYQADTGTYLFEGRVVHVGSPQAAVALGIATVYQDLALCDNLDVVANLFLGRELAAAPVAGRLRRLREPQMERLARDTLTGLAVKIPSLRLPVAALSGGQRQSVAVSRAVLWGSKVVVLDEPTAALGVEQTALVLDLVRTLAERGIGVVLVSHNLANVFEVADRMVVLRLGRPAGTFDRAGTEPDQVVAAITGGAAVRRRYA
jgi:D-xylose transport system ATP-binding protein